MVGAVSCGGEAVASAPRAADALPFGCDAFDGYPDVAGSAVGDGGAGACGDLGPGVVSAQPPDVVGLTLSMGDGSQGGFGDAEQDA